MSTQRGNVSKKPQKHQNTVAFKIDKYVVPKNMPLLSKVSCAGLCSRCEDIIEWKIKYNKYKPLTTAARCSKCQQKTVKSAYHQICIPCGNANKVCLKCIEPSADLKFMPTEEEKRHMDQDEQEKIKAMSERQRRTYLRNLERQKVEEQGASKEAQRKARRQARLKAAAEAAASGEKPPGDSDGDEDEDDSGSDFGDDDDEDDDEDAGDKQAQKSRKEDKANRVPSSSIKASQDKSSSTVLDKEASSDVHVSFADETKPVSAPTDKLVQGESLSVVVDGDEDDDDDDDDDDDLEGLDDDEEDF